MRLEPFSSWPGIAVRRTASLPLAYVPAICVSLGGHKDVMPGTRQGMTSEGSIGRTSLSRINHIRETHATVRSGPEIFAGTVMSFTAGFGG